MYIFLTDETNEQPSSRGRFFIYGGVFFPIDKIDNLDAGMRQIRRDAGFCDGEAFKFDTNCRSEKISPEAHAKAKDQVLNLCLEQGVRFIAYLVHHDIVHSQETKIDYAISTVLEKFNRFLVAENAVGLCVLDRLPDVPRSFKLIENKFQKGLEYLGGEIRPLNKIKLISMGSILSSHVASLPDIILGAFRYGINEGEQNQDIASLLMRKVVKLMWQKNENDNIYILEKGLILRPIKPSIVYKAEYEKIVKKINLLLEEKE